MVQKTLSSYKAKLDLSKLSNVQVRNEGGRKIVAIPADDNNLFISERTGSIYLDMVVNEYFEPKYGATHYIKRNLSRDEYMKLSTEEKKNIPIVGTMQPMNTPSQNNNETKRDNNTNTNTQQPVTVDNLPF